MFDRVVNAAHLNLHKFSLGSETWGQQFYEAMNVNGGDPDGATTMDYIMHFVTFFWKVPTFLLCMKYCYKRFNPMKLIILLCDVLN